MTNFQTHLLLSISFLIPTLSPAQSFQYAVNMKNGSLLIKEKEELKLESAGFNFTVERWYRSRSLFRGAFGQGWCSPFDEKLHLKTKGILELTTCSSPQPVTFQLNPQANEYISMINSDDRIKMNFGSYTRYLKMIKVSQFNYSGELKKIIQNNKEWTVRRNSRKLISSIQSATGEQILLRWHPLIDLIEDIQSRKSQLRYRHSGFLLKTVGDKKYDYDDLDNLTRRTRLSDLLHITYNISEDRVTEIRGLCSEKYDYQTQPHNRLISSVSVQCPKKQKISQIFKDNRLSLNSQ